MQTLVSYTFEQEALGFAQSSRVAGRWGSNMPNGLWSKRRRRSGQRFPEFPRQLFFHFPSLLHLDGPYLRNTIAVMLSRREMRKAAFGVHFVIQRGNLADPNERPAQAHLPAPLSGHTGPILLYSSI